MINKSICFLLCALFLPFLSFSMTYMTNQVRTQTVTTLCASFFNRDQIVSTADTTQVQQYNQVMKASFSVKGNDLFKTALQKQDPQVILQQYPNLPQEYGLFVGPFAVGMIIMMFTCMCTCCCCCCPQCCPPCCRQEAGKPYSKCELVWPAIILILGLGLILAAGAIGLSKSKDIQTTIQAVGCAVSISLDDIINGNVTTTGKFFVGLRTLYNQIGTIKTGLGTVDTQLTAIIPTGPTFSAVYGTGTSARDSIGVLPSGTNATRMPAYNYKTPFDSVTATATLPSDFPATLGSNAAADAGTPTYLTYVALDTIQTSLNQIAGGAQSLKTTISGTFNSSLDSAKTQLGKVADTLESGDLQFFTIYSQASQYFPTINTAVTGIYAGLVGVAAVGILATLLLIICNMYKCRLLLYFVCVVLVVVGIICFFLCIIVSALIPVVYFSCDFLTFSLTNANNFNSNFGSLVSASFSSMITVCLKQQSGDFLQATGLGAAASSLTDLRAMIGVMNTFDSVAVNNQVDAAWTPLYDLVSNSYSGKILDFTSTSDQAILQRISNPTNYACSDPQFAGDSWVPTAATGTTISCKVTSNYAGTTQCGAAADLAAGTNSCLGCLSAHQILNVYSGTLAASLASRYSTGDCATFISDLGYAYANYYGRKETNFAPLLTRGGTSAGWIAGYKTTITSFGTAITNVKTNLESTVNSIVDPTYGIMAGLNCAILGEDIFLVINTVCTHGFKLSFFIRAAFGIAGFGILITMYCASCTGVRHFRQADANSKAKLQVKDITNETMEDIVPVQGKYGQKAKPGKGTVTNSNIIPPNNTYY